MYEISSKLIKSFPAIRPNEAQEAAINNITIKRESFLESRNSNS